MIRTTAMVLVVLAAANAPAIAASARVRISARPEHAGRISRYLFGSFIELLDDLVPGMRAQMLNDRGFDGVQPRANWCYYTGEPNTCDREWDRNDTWAYDNVKPLVGPRSAKLMPRKGRPASLTQPGLATKKGMAYLFSGHLRSQGPDVRARAILKSQLPDGKWMEFGSCPLPRAAGEWRRFECRMVSSGTSDRAVFELKATGTGALWADKLSLMPADNIKGWRKDVVQAIKEAQPGLIRWGGSAIDPGGYRWKDGIGDPDSRKAFANKVWGRIDSNDVGIDEFLTFCELVGAEPLVCLSFSDGADSAGDLVEYCNGTITTKWGATRAANGHPKPYGVKFWQIGNELGDQSYIDGCPEFCKAIRKADPRPVILASYPSKALLEKAGPSLDYVCPHHYTDDLNACDASFKEIADMIAATPGCSHIKVGVTEWNVSAGLWGLQRASFLTLSCALKNARYLNLLLRHSDLAEIACRSNMTNSLCSGMLQTSPAGLYKTPSYYVMKLYARHAKQVYVPVQDSPEGLDVVATASQDQKSLCMFAVNQRSEPIELSVDLGGYVGLKLVAAEAVCDTLDKRQPDAMNHPARPDTIRAVALHSTPGGVILPALSASAVEFMTP
jgi:alpha-N-arabinofuranosidase